MTATTFNSYLTKKLCWIDGAHTHASSERQRQCGRCRKKWSYEGVSKRWILAQEYCAGHNRREAAVAAGVDVHTAGRHYAAFEKALADRVLRMLRKGEAWRLGDAEGIHVSLRKRGKKPRPRRQRGLLAALCLAHLGLHERLALLFESVFLPQLQRRLGKRPVG